MRSLSALPLLALAQPVFAQDAPAPVDQATGEEIRPEGDEILVIAQRLKGQVDAPQVPIVTLNEEDIASYGAASLSDLIAAVSPQTTSGRGRGGGGPVILINGQRISNFREMRNIPPEAIRRMEVLPEEVALRYGYPPNQRVINFILRDNFASKTIEAEYHFPTRGGFDENQFEATLLKINKSNRLNIYARANDASMLTEAERGVRQQPGTVPTVSGDPDPARFRSLVPDTADYALNGSWTTGLGEGGKDGSLSLNAGFTRNDSRSLSGLDTVLLTYNGNSALRTLPDPLIRTSRTDTFTGGAALNKPLGDWQLTVTLDGSRGVTTTRIDQRRDMKPLSDAAAAGALAIDGPLPAVALGGIDVARSHNDSLTSLATATGRPFRLPAGDASLTLKGGFAYTGIRSSDTRTTAGDTRLNRGDLSAGINLALPIASRKEHVLEAIGDLSLNFSAGLDRLSDFGTLKDWSAGLTWAPLEKLSLQASYIYNEAAPSLSDLGGPLIRNFNVPVFDFTRGTTALVTVTSGGNPALRRETQRDLKLSANWELPFLKNSNLTVEYFRNHSSDVTNAFPVLTPEIEAAFLAYVVRDSAGNLVSIDRRPVTFSETRGSRLRWGFNLSGPLGKPQARERQGGSWGGGTGRGGGPRPDGARRGGRGMGGGGMGGMFGGGGGQGRWNLSIYHTIRFSESVLVAPGGPALDLLDGDALTGGGVARHALEFEGGTFYKGFGLRLNGSWAAPTHLRANGLTSASDLRFGSVFNLDLRAFVNFDQKAERDQVRALPQAFASRQSKSKICSIRASG